MCIRDSNFSLYGYPRDTNPLLSKTPGIIAFPDATTQSNTTHKSVPMLLSAASAEDFERLFHEKGILAAFREAGFHTVFISNQLPNHSFIDFLGEQADEHYFLKEGASAKDNHYDSDLLQKLDGILPAADASSSKQYRYRKLFVVLHTYGSHFNYQERYPRNFAFFKPDCKSEAKPENRRDLLNAYDNTCLLYTSYAGDLAAVISHIIETDQLDKTGIYHFSNEGVCSWFDFAKIICELSGNTCDIQPCYSEEFPSPVKRPHFSVLDKSKLKQTFGFKVPYWTDSLKKCIAELAAAK